MITNKVFLIIDGNSIPKFAKRTNKFWKVFQRPTFDLIL